jgi:Arc/MetJ-type ribon-helix-helix transcriptional regulator
MLGGMHTEQIAVRIDRAQLAALDTLIEEGEFESRAAAVRAGLAAVIGAVESRRIDDALRAGYTLHPPTPGERIAAEAALREAIEEEPW